MRTQHLTLSTALVICLLSAQPAWTQATGAGVTPETQTPTSSAAQPSDQLEEIMVTAQKRTERLLDVPIAVSAVSADTINSLGISTIAGLGMAVPNVAIMPVSVIPSAAITFIRGVGERSSDPTVEQPNLISVDGVYVQGVTGALEDTFDLQQVEVLRGPQGTLEGRNASGGAINLTTRRPNFDEWDVRTSLEYGTFETWTAKFGVDGPLVDHTLAAKFSVVSTDSQGYERDVYADTRMGGRKYTDVRFGLLFTPSETFNLYVSSYFINDESQQAAGHAVNVDVDYPRPQTQGQGITTICTVFGVCTPSPNWVNTSNYTRPNHTNQGGLTENANWQVGGVNLTSITGYREVHDTLNLDLDFTELPLIQVENYFFNMHQLSQEFRVASEKNGGLDLGGRLTWVAGLFYLNDSWSLNEPVCLPALGVSCNPVPPSSISHDSQKTQSYAGFAHADFSLTDQWGVFAGTRYTEDKKQFIDLVPTVVFEDRSWSKATAEAGTNFHFTPNEVAYFKFSQGYRTGGINTNGVAYNPETINSYELGLKMEEWDRRLILSTAVFHYDQKNLQRDVVLPYAQPPFYIQAVTNAAKAKTDGAELEATVLPLQSLRVQSSIGYLDNKYTSFIDYRTNANGTITPVDDSALALPYSPKWTTNLSSDYTIHLNNLIRAFDSVVLFANYSYRTAFYANPMALPVGYQAGYGLLDLSVSLVSKSGKYSVTGFGNNVTDKHYILAGENDGGLNLYAIEGPPSTYGVRFTAEF